MRVGLNAGGAPKSIDAEAILVAVGRGPISGDLGLDKLAIELERGGFIKTDDSFRTNCPSVYAIGDVARPPLLAHKASAEGVAAVEIMAGIREPGFDLLSIPACIYCEPEVASVGWSEADAKAHGIEVERGPMQRFGAKGQGTSVYFRDPDGSLMEFMSYTSVNQGERR